MAHSPLRLRLGALATAAGLTLAGLAAAAPATAAEVDAPVISLDQTTFPAGDWEGGFTVTGSGFDPSVPTAQLTIGSMGQNGGGSLYDQSVAVSSDGTIEALIVPTAPTQAPDAEGFPKYGVSVAQEIAPGQPWIFSNNVELTITEGASLTGPEQLNTDEVAAGVAAQFAGFAAGEAIAYEFVLERWSEAEGTRVIAEAAGVTNADAAGAGTISAALAGAQAEDFITISISGEESGRVAAAWVQVVAAPAPAPAPAPADPTAAPAAPAAQTARLPETGIDLGVGIAALALLVLGAGAVLVTRRERAAAHQR